MKQALENIVEVTYNNATYFMSVVQKQNDSGIMFNQRIFYLLPAQCIGYISDVRINDPPHAIIFSNPKIEIKISSITNTLLNGNELTIIFLESINGKRMESSWLLKMESSDLAKRWWTKLSKQKKNEIERSTPVRKQTSKKSYKRQKEEKHSIKDKKMLQISKNLNFSEILKKQKSLKQIGINTNLNSDESKFKVQFTEKKQFGTAMSQHFNSMNIDKSQRQKSMIKQQSDKILKKIQEIRHVKEQETQYNIENKKLTVKKQQSIHISNHNQQSTKLQKEADVDCQNIVIQDMKNFFNKNRSNHLQQSPSQKSSINNVIDMSIFPNQSTFKSPFKKNNYNLDPSLIPFHKITDYMPLNKSIPSNQTRSLLQKPNISSEQNLSKFDSIHSRSFRSYLQNNYTIYQFQDIQNKNLPWTFKYLKYHQHMFEQFKTNCKKILTDLIEDYKKAKQQRLFKPRLIRNGIYHYEINNLSIKIALDIKQGIKNKTEKSNSIKFSQIKASKVIQNQFHIFNQLYQRLDHKSRLKVPLVCICEINGFVGLFKTIARAIPPKGHIYEIQSEVKNLKKIFNINPNFLQNVHKYIVKLDDSYYNSLRRKEDQQIAFNYYFLQDIQNFMIPNYVTNSINKTIIIPRKQFSKPHGQIVQKLKTNLEMDIKEFYSGKRNIQTDLFYQKIKNSLLAAVQEIDSLAVYFFSSKELGNYLHQKGINICFIGFLYQNVTTVFQKNVLMAQAASRSCKKILRKIMQQKTMQNNQLQKEGLNSKVQILLNHILQNPLQNSFIWNVIKENCLTFFGIDINLNSIPKNYFLISLIQQCKIDVIWQNIKPDLVFKSKSFFDEQNFKGILAQFKIYTPFYNQQYKIACRIMEEQKTQEGLKELLYYLNLHKDPITQSFTEIEDKIKQYLSYFINSDQAELEYSHLNLYINIQSANPNKNLFSLQLMKMKWFLKCNQKEKYMSCCNTFIKTIINCYGEFFPVLSQLYDILSSYHFANDNYEDTITFAKSSLVNMINICGVNHEKSGQCYFQLGLYYLKMNRLKEALIQIKKAKNIFEIINMADTSIYALICLKLSFLFLNCNQIQNCLAEGLKSLAIFQSINSIQYEDQMAETYEIIYRCYIRTHSIKKISEISQRCSLRLPDIKDPNNLKKMLSIYLYPILSDVPPETASNYIDIINQMTQIFDKQQFIQSSESIRVRLREGSFKNSFQYYLGNLIFCKEQALSANILRKWQSFKQVYPRQTVKDFISLTEELIIFLGKEFLTDSLRQSLILK